MTDDTLDAPSAGGKEPGAFRTISEVAEELGLPQHVLRFWETRFPQIKPIKRGGGRRYYRPNDVDLLRGVKQLLYGEGYTIRGVQRILREQGGRKLASDTGARGGASTPPADVEATRKPSPESLAGSPAGPEIWAPRSRAAAPAPDEEGFAREEPVPEELARPAPPQPGRARLSDDQLGRLSNVLSELVACRRLLDERS